MHLNDAYSLYCEGSGVTSLPHNPHFIHLIRWVFGSGKEIICLQIIVNYLFSCLQLSQMPQKGSFQFHKSSSGRQRHGFAAQNTLTHVAQGRTDGLQLTPKALRTWREEPRIFCRSLARFGLQQCNCNRVFNTLRPQNSLDYVCVYGFVIHSGKRSTRKRVD